VVKVKPASDICEMKNESAANYAKIEKAIKFMSDNFKQQPSMEQIAAVAGFSPFHFQRVFLEWAGTTPKKFLQLTSIQFAKDLLSQKYSIESASYHTGFSSPSRLHDLFINIEGMSPGEYKNGGEGLHIEYSFSSCLFGNILIASTTKGICFLSFYNEENNAVNALKKMFPLATFCEKLSLFQKDALTIFTQNWNELPKIKLHLKASNFQLRVWQALLHIPQGGVQSYAKLAEQSGHRGASRAVGTAVGKNPVAYLIPCHRVIQASGNFGQYMWGRDRKTAILGWEFSQQAEFNDNIQVQV
jgi:AraC family transcriptional regulator of adaptative response/methylated-DNA-[protein]-cysteine methyltransferase